MMQMINLYNLQLFVKNYNTNILSTIVSIVSFKMHALFSAFKFILFKKTKKKLMGQHQGAA
jgi:hypothetical protein